MGCLGGDCILLSDDEMTGSRVPLEDGVSISECETSMLFIL